MIEGEIKNLQGVVSGLKSFMEGNSEKEGLEK
jgi:hypothetical protein